MKKRLFSLLLAVVLVSSMIVMPAGAQTAKTEETETVTNNKTDRADLCPCGCGQLLSNVRWQVYDPNHVDISSGHYYMEGDYIQNGQKEIMSGDRIVLDLRGHTLTSKSYGRLYLVYGQLYVLDTVGGGLFMSKTSGSAYGGVVMVSTNETNDSLFELLSGTIMPDADNMGSRRGGLIHLSETATFRMTGGRLMNGSTVSTSNPDKKEQGGCVAGYSAACTIEILGGEIIGGESSTSGGNIYSVGTTILKNCKIIGGTATTYGGNIYQNGGSLTIENCTISDGVAYGTSNGGGNISVMTSTVLTVKDSTIRNGYSAYHGGNIYMGTSSGSIENTEIIAGVAANRGGNIYGASSTTALTVKDCQIPGDVTYIGKGLTLEGQVKIGLLNNGLRLWYKDYYPVMDASGLTEGSEIYVDANHTFTEAGANLAYFKGAIRTVLTETAEGLVGTQAAAGAQGGYCPHCGEQVTWQAFSTTDSLVQNCLLDAADDTDPACTGRHLESGHYYLTASITGMTQYYSGIYLSGSKAAKDVVLDLAGYSLTATGRAFYLRPGDTAAGVPQSSLTMLDSFGGSVVTGRGASDQGGGVIYNEGSKLTIYGGKYVYNPVSGRNVTGAGVIQGGSEFTMHGGILDGSAFTYTDASTTDKTYTYNGGALNMGSGSTKTFTMTAGRLVGGTAQSGGAAYFGYNNKVNITGGQFYGGTTDSASGGCIRMYGTSSNKSAQFNMSNASVRGGSITTTATGGGNMSLGYGTITVKNTYIEGGTAATYGGNLSVGTSSTATFTNCIIAGGTAGTQGGNIHTSATSAQLSLDSCLLTVGTATTYGGNLNAGNGIVTIKGGEVSFGTAGTYGGNINSTTGNSSESNYTRICADDAGNVPLLAGGSAGTYGGNLCAQSLVQVEAAVFANGKAATLGQDIYLSKAGTRLKLTIGAGVTGDVSVGVNVTNLTEAVYGDPIANTACDTLNARMILEGDYKNALLCAKDGSLYVGAYAVVDEAGAMTWYADVASALAACQEGSFVRLYLDSEITLTKDATLDINGNTVSISGDYTVCVMDSVGGGTATLAEGTQTPAEFTAPDGIRYLTTVENGVVTAHPLDMKITGVSLRTSAAGVYYTGTWIADEVTSQLIESYGVAVSTAKAPDENFMALNSQCMWTAQKGELDRDTKEYSVLISGIMKTLEEDANRTAEENKRNGETKIHAVAYVKLKDGNMLLSDSVSCSLYDVMKMVDDRILSDSVNFRKYTNSMRAFYSNWESFGMGDWSFNKVQPPVDDGVIDVLMIGSSFCYYYVEELVAVAEAAGIPMRVCNVYYSGCKLEWHYNWWLEGKANYQFFDTTAFNKRKQTNNVSLEWCLAQGDWDVVSIQQSTSSTFNAGAEKHFADTTVQRQTMIGYLQEQFPEALICWHQPWCRDTDSVLDDGTVVDRAWQERNWQCLRTYALMTVEEMGVQRINTGDAWMYFRHNYVDGEAQLPDTLCKRLGKSSFNGQPDSGDGYHDGDIGGGQLLNAYVWFEIITGESCLGNTFRPTYANKYTLDEELVLALQDSAHQAVLQLRADEAAQ